MKILIIEDGHTSNSFLKGVLEAEGHSVIATNNGGQALAMLECKVPIDLIISDAANPLMHGYALLSLVKNDVMFKTVPFIIYTPQYTSRGHEALAYSLGADLYVRKSGHAKEIVEAVEAVLTHKK